MTFHAYTVVRTTEVARLRAYLYSHTDISQSLSEPGAVVLVTTSEQSQHNADYLAQYQADRLSSGLFSVSSGFDNEASASEHAIEIATPRAEPKPEKIGTHCECGAPYVYLEAHNQWGYACAR